MSLVRVQISPQAHKPPRLWGNQLYFTGGLGWANTIKTGSVSLHTGKADGGRTQLDPAVWNFKLNQFGALLVPQAKLSLKWRGQSSEPFIPGLALHKLKWQRQGNRLAPIQISRVQSWGMKGQSSFMLSRTLSMLHTSSEAAALRLSGSCVEGSLLLGFASPESSLHKFA